MVTGSKQAGTGQSGDAGVPSGQTFFMKDEYGLDHDCIGGSGETQIPILTGVGEARGFHESPRSQGD